MESIYVNQEADRAVLAEACDHAATLTANLSKRAEAQGDMGTAGVYGMVAYGYAELAEQLAALSCPDTHSPIGRIVISDQGLAETLYRAVVLFTGGVMVKELVESHSPDVCNYARRVEAVMFTIARQLAELVSGR